MKFLIFMVLAFGTVNSTVGQILCDSSSVYSQAFIKHMNVEINRIDSYSVYLVEKNYITTNNLPEEINGIKIEVLSREDILQRLKTVKSIHLFSIVPIQCTDNELILNVILFSVSGNKRKLYYSNTMNGSSFNLEINEVNSCVELVLKE